MKTIRYQVKKERSKGKSWTIIISSIQFTEETKHFLNTNFLNFLNSNPSKIRILIIIEDLTH